MAARRRHLLTCIRAEPANCFKGWERRVAMSLPDGSVLQLEHLLLDVLGNAADVSALQLAARAHGVRANEAECLVAKAHLARVALKCLPNHRLQAVGQLIECGGGGPVAAG